MHPRRRGSSRFEPSGAQAGAAAAPRGCRAATGASRGDGRPAEWRLRVLLVVLAAGCSNGAAAGVSAVDMAEPIEPGFRGRAVYEIFVRSFADHDGDGVGDLRGLLDHLDYLNDGRPGSATSLGVEALWLMPLQPSPSYHGYDVTDYRAINPQYGTLADFDALVAAAHQRGLKILIDMVINHSSSQHPWFLDSQGGPTAARRSWYVWSDTDPGWPKPWGDPSDSWNPLGRAFYYSPFCGCMPDLNLRNPAVEQEMIDSMKFWLARGVDGFRLDAVRYYIETGRGMQADLPETHALIKRLRSALTAAAPEVILVGEAWTALEVQATYYGTGDELQLAFSFDLADALKASAAAGDVTQVVNLLARSESAYQGKDRSFEAPFLSNHDQARVMRALAGDAGAARVAAATLFALPGTPFVYYGEELGMLGGPGNDDRNKRTPFRWNAGSPQHGFTSASSAWFSSDEADGVDVASQQAAPASLWNEYRALIALRRAQPVLQRGNATRPVRGGGGNGLLAVLRSTASGRVLFVANYGATPTGPFTIDLDAAAAATSTLLSEGLAGAPAASSGRLSFPGLLPHGFAFVALT